MELDLNKEKFRFTTSSGAAYPTYQGIVDDPKHVMIAAFLLANYKDISDLSLPRSTYKTFVAKNTHKSNGREAMCKKLSAAVSMTQSDASIEAASSSPGAGCSNRELLVVCAQREFGVETWHAFVCKYGIAMTK